MLLFLFSDYEITDHDGTRSIRDIIANCLETSFLNSTFDEQSMRRQKRAFEQKVQQEAEKLPENKKPSFYAQAFSMATEKIISNIKVLYL